MAEDLYGLGASGIPPELAAEMMGIKGRKAISQALLEQSMQPLQAPEVKGRFSVPISPLQGIAKLAQSYMGQKGLTEADKSMAGVGQKYQSGVADALTKAEQLRQGVPAVEYQPGVSQGPVMPKPAVQGDPQEAVKFALQNQYLQKHPYTQFLAQRAGKAEDLAAASENRKAETAARQESDQAFRKQMQEQAELDRKTAREQSQADREQNIRLQSELRMQEKLATIEANKQSKLDAAKGKQDEAKSRVSAELSTLNDYYNELSRLGSAIDTQKSGAKNVASSVAASTPGQYLGKMFGTEAQSWRNKINQMRPLLLQEIRQASGQGARGLDSNKELEFYLQAATDPSRDIQANRAAMAVLNKAYGLESGIIGIPQEETKLQNEFKKTSPSAITKESSNMSDDSGWKDM